MRDAEFIKKYENIINEIIGDFATYEENSKDSKYPFLRYFSTYEGHSWASGHANFGDGNNQESSSEAINAWAGLILYGQAIGNKELTSLGMYLYATEVSSVNCYWFDTDGDILDEQCDPEAGESKAHAFNWIMAMQKNGTPDLTVTSDNPLACAFKNADGEMTYTAYNTTDEDVNVTFSDGTELVAKPHTMTTTGDREVTTKSTYKVEHYLSDGNGNYTLVNTEKKSGKIGNEVTAVANTYQGYKFNPEVEGTVQSGVIAEDGSLVLKLYVKARAYRIVDNKRIYGKWTKKKVVKK